jgi:hypothetical protein
MYKVPALRCAFLVFLSCFFLLPGSTSAQLIDRISSEHVNMRMPIGRESLARDMISEIERCYGFMDKATGGSLPRKIMINVLWDQAESSCSLQSSSITVGMNRPEKAVNLNTLLMHKTGREIARLALLELSKGAQREDTEFLFEGMVEILVHEFDRSSRSLEAAWAIAKLFDEAQLLGINMQRAWTSFSAGKRCHSSAAPGITFLSTYRELQGRERPIKLFEALKGSGLTNSLAATFKAPVAELEKTWLKRVREHAVVDAITLVEEDAPQLQRIEGNSETSPGNSLQLRLFFKDRDINLIPEGVFVKDERTGKLIQAQAAAEKDAEYLMAGIPVETDCPPGQYGYQITAVDEAGNLRRWSRRYTVGSR